jgi:Family of unknown function (DUF5427)
MSKGNKDVLQFLDSFDDIPDASIGSKQPKPSVVGQGTPSATTAGTAGEAAEALAFLDELTQQSSRPTRVLTPGPRVRNTANASPAPGGGARSSTPGGGNVPASNNGLSTSQAAASSKNDGAVKADEPSGSGGWGWGSVWTSASAALVQAKNVVEEQVKTLPSEPAKKWSEGLVTYVKATQLDKLGEDVSFTKYKYTFLTYFDPSRRQRYPRCWSVHPIPNDQRRRTPYRRTRSDSSLAITRHARLRRR